MGKIFPNWRIPAAVLFSVALIAGAYVFAHGVAVPPSAEASAETALLQAIAAKDSTGDGLPDWEKVLYGIPIDATTTDYFHLGMTDGEAVAKGLIVPKAIADIPTATSSPAANNGVDYASAGLTPPSEGTLTDTFAKNFFTLYAAAKEANGGADLSDDQVNALADQALNQFASSVIPTPDFKSATDLTVSGSGPDALKAFAVNAEAVLKANKSDATKNGIYYLQDEIQNNDSTASEHLLSIAKSYRSAAVGMSALTVPSELAATDLTLINSMMRISEIMNDFAAVQTDPLSAMAALNQYSGADIALAKSFMDVSNIYAAAGISLPAGAPGATFVNALSDFEARAHGISVGSGTKP